MHINDDVHFSLFHCLNSHNENVMSVNPLYANTHFNHCIFLGNFKNKIYIT